MEPTWDGVMLRHAVKKARRETSPREDICYRNDAQVLSRKALVKHMHAEFLKRALCKYSGVRTIIIMMTRSMD